jgi:hypothetical protein
MNIQNLIKKAKFKTQSYSGRGMYGRKCLGVVLKEGQTTGQFFSKVIMTINDYCTADEMFEVLPDIANICEVMCSDSLGLGKIVYFPGVEFEGEEEPEEGSEEDDNNE